MHPVKVESRSVPPDSTPYYKKEESLDHYIDPFVHMLYVTTSTAFSATMDVMDIGFRVWAAVEDVFKRLIYGPLFDPLDPAFKTKFLANYENQLPALENKILLLSQKFKHDYLIARDMAEFHQLAMEIKGKHDQLNNYLYILSKHSPIAVKDDLQKTTNLYKELHDKMVAFCEQKGNHILDSYKRALDIFSRGLELPEEIKKDLLKTWILIDESLGYYAYRVNSPYTRGKLQENLYARKNQVENLDLQDTQVKRGSITEPLKLKNIGNSCYLDSVFQAFACIDQVREQIGLPIEQVPPSHPNPTKWHYEEAQKAYVGKLAIQQELIPFLKVDPHVDLQGEHSQMEYILSLFGESSGPSLHRLRSEIFKSKLHNEFQDIGELTHQHDAAAVAELLLDMLPKCKYKIQKRLKTDAYPGLEWHRSIPPESMLQIPLRNKEHQELKQLIHWVMHWHLMKETSKFDPADGEAVVVKDEGEQSLKKEKNDKVPEYAESWRFKELPNVLTLQFKRMTNSLQKDERPVDLPADGIVDLTRYYDAPDSADKTAKYKIKSIVVHHGTSLRAGHYISYVEMNGKYFICDDMSSKLYREVEASEFYGCKDAYLLVLERLPAEDEVNDSKVPSLAKEPQTVTKAR